MGPGSISCALVFFDYSRFKFYSNSCYRFYFITDFITGFVTVGSANITVSLGFIIADSGSLIGSNIGTLSSRTG